tara:strand:- start:121 stop:390 length:270 start_codon:yes stop_codon:yes gene_type:complete
MQINIRKEALADNLIDLIRKLNACKIFKRAEQYYGQPELIKLKCHLAKEAGGLDELNYDESIAQEIEDFFTAINTVRNAYPLGENHGRK